MSPKKGLVLVEGPTEAAFVDQILAPHLSRSGLFLRARRLDGVSRYGLLRGEVVRLLNDTSAVVVTTMLDFYRFPADFTGTPRSNDPGEGRVVSLEVAIAADLGQENRFLPYLSRHEFEALVLATGPALLSVLPGYESNVSQLLTSVEAFKTPEDIDDGPRTHPSMRLELLVPAFKKRVDGLLAIQRAGLPALRARCPHFDSWVTRLEALAQAP